MSDAPSKTPLQKLEAICAEIYQRWDSDQRSGKLLGALAGSLPNYRQDVTDVREALKAAAPVVMSPEDILHEIKKQFDAMEHQIERHAWALSTIVVNLAHGAPGNKVLEWYYKEAEHQIAPLSGQRP